jgi:hypothetical protein
MAGSNSNADGNFLAITRNKEAAGISGCRELWEGLLIQSRPRIGLREADLGESKSQDGDPSEDESTRRCKLEGHQAKPKYDENDELGETTGEVAASDAYEQENDKRIKDKHTPGVRVQYNGGGRLDD